MQKTTTFICTVLCSVLLVAHAVCGQKRIHRNPEKWYPGKVVFNSGKTTEGRIMYEHAGSEKEIETVSVFTGNVISIYHADSVSDFAYTCDDQDMVYTSLPYQFPGQLPRMYFFQVLEDGNLTLLKRTYQQVVTVSRTNAALAPSVSASGMIMPAVTFASYPVEAENVSAQHYITFRTGQHVTIDVLYVVDEEAETIKECPDTKKELLDFMNAHQAEMEEFIGRQMILHSHDREQVFRRIVRKYNSLVEN